MLNLALNIYHAQIKLGQVLTSFSAEAMLSVEAVTEDITMAIPRRQPRSS